MGEKVLVLQDGAQKQLKGWGYPVRGEGGGKTAGRRGGEGEEEEEVGEGSDLLLEARASVLTSGGGLHPEKVWPSGHPSLLLFENLETNS